MVYFCRRKNISKLSIGNNYPLGTPHYSTICTVLLQRCWYFLRQDYKNTSSNVQIISPINNEKRKKRREKRTWRTNHLYVVTWQEVFYVVGLTEIVRIYSWILERVARLKSYCTSACQLINNDYEGKTMMIWS